MLKKQEKKLLIKKSTPNPVAKNLRTPQYKSQVIPSQKIYNRKKINKTADQAQSFDMMGYGWWVYIRGCKDKTILIY